MSIEKQHGQTSLVCDGCGDDLGEFFSGFRTMIVHAKSEGWQIKPDDQGGYTHLCPSCDSPASSLAGQKKIFGL